MVSHLPEIHAYLADRLIFLENGKIAADGEPAWVLKNFLRDMKPRKELSEPGNKEACIKVRDISKRYSLIRMGEVLRITSYNVCYTKLLRGQGTRSITSRMHKDYRLGVLPENSSQE